MKIKPTDIQMGSKVYVLHSGGCYPAIFDGIVNEEGNAKLRCKVEMILEPGAVVLPVDGGGKKNG